MWELQIDWLYFRVNWRIYIHIRGHWLIHIRTRGFITILVSATKGTFLSIRINGTPYQPNILHATMCTLWIKNFRDGKIMVKVTKFSVKNSVNKGNFPLGAFSENSPQKCFRGFLSATSLDLLQFTSVIFFTIRHGFPHIFHYSELVQVGKKISWLCIFNIVFKMAKACDCS